MAYTILDQVKIRLRQMHVESVDNMDGTTSDSIVFDEAEENPILEAMIEGNKELIICRIDPPAYYTAEQKEEILDKYKGAIVEMTLYDSRKEKGEFETSHTEPGVSRSWISKDEIMDYFNIHTFSKVVKA